MKARVDMATLVGWVVGVVCGVLLAAIIVAALVGTLLGGDEAMDATGMELGSATEEGMQPG